MVFARTRTAWKRVFLALVVPLTGVAQLAPERDILAELLAANGDWLASDQDFREFREAESPDEWEIQDYAEFVAGLKRRVIILCQEAREAGESPEDVGVDCEELSQQAEDASNLAEAAVPDRPMSAEEQEAELLAKMERIESEFDELLMSEQEMVYREESGGAAGGGSGGGGGGQSGGGGGGSGGDPGGEEEPAGASGPGGGVAAQGGNEGGTGPGIPKEGDTQTQPELPPAADDDIVARQLREAAENETDPYLKEQLWKEYWKYKNSRK
ncbi:MAG: hypothetical protein AB3N64_12110 [Puniceicoccaceae bacterium]